MKIVVQNLIKSYGSKNAIDDISFEINDDNFFTLAGANGAGKSTLIDIMLNRIKETSGKLLIDGKEIVDYKLFKEVGVVFQDNVLDKELSAYQNIFIRAKMYHSKKEASQQTEYWLEKLQIKNIRNTRYEKLSGGERRKVDLIVALIGKPKLLIMDEPTTGIDAQSRKEIWECINEIRRQSKLTILLTTHYLEESEQSDNMIILKNGSIIAKGSPYELKQQYVKKECYLYSNEVGKLRARLNDKGIETLVEQNKVIVTFNTNSECITLLEEYKDYYDDFEVVLGSLEKAFMNIMKGDG